jgi:hypothetical protein
MTAGARLLGDANVSAVAWAGTAGSWLGLGHDRERGIDPGRPDHALYRVRSGPDHPTFTARGRSWRPRATSGLPSTTRLPPSPQFRRGTQDISDKHRRSMRLATFVRPDGDPTVMCPFFGDSPDPTSSTYIDLCHQSGAIRGLGPIGATQRKPDRTGVACLGVKPCTRLLRGRQR